MDVPPQLGYSFRMDFADFAKRYKNVVFKYHQNPPETRETCNTILAKIKLDNYQLGNTKVFMKYYHRSESFRQVDFSCVTALV